MPAHGLFKQPAASLGQAARLSYRPINVRLIQFMYDSRHAIRGPIEYVFDFYCGVGCKEERDTV